MLSGSMNRDISVTKGSAREFISFCVELSKARPEHYQQILESALARGAFKTQIHIDSAFSYFGKRIPALVENVTILATCVSGERSFQIETNNAIAVGGGRGELIHHGRPGGTVRYLRSLDLRSIGTEVELIKECERNFLVDVFYDVLSSVLCQQPGLGEEKMLPIRLCPECEQPFFARRWDQAFCNQKHSQRWRSRESYRRKKVQEK